MGQVAVIEGASRAKILDAAEALFARRGYSGVGMREVAEAAGLGKSSLFHHFSSKTELYAAVVGRILEIVEARTLKAIAAGGDVVVRFDRWIDTLIDTLAEQRSTARLLLRSLFEDDELSGESAEEQHVNGIIERLFTHVAHLLREGMEAGLFRKASIPHTMQSLIGLTVYHFASGEFGEEITGRPLFDPEAVRKRKQEVKALLHGGLIAKSAGRRSEAKQGRI
jgi:TetR/AcrR family transcriptional regulator